MRRSEMEKSDDVNPQKSVFIAELTGRIGCYDTMESFVGISLMYVVIRKIMLKVSKAEEDAEEAYKLLRMVKKYVVFVGKNPGIYNSWELCKAQVDRFPNAVHCKYDDINEALAAFQIFIAEQEWISKNTEYKCPSCAHILKAKISNSKNTIGQHYIYCKAIKEVAKAATTLIIAHPTRLEISLVATTFALIVLKNPDSCVDMDQ